MKDYYYILDNLIALELKKNQNIAIYPFGRVGLQAKIIMNERYGRQPIIIDNNVSKYNQDVLCIERFEKIDNKQITLLLCATNPALNKMLMKDLEMRNLVSKVINVLNPEGVTHVPEKKEYFDDIKKLCKVYKVMENRLLRVGSENDGGYIMLDDFEENSIVYSFGIGGNITWEEDMSCRNMDVYCYDHTIEELPTQNERLHFNKIGIAGQDQERQNLLSMESIINRNGHKGVGNLILKMDVEGAEWEFINTVDDNILKQFSQMTFELHDMTEMTKSEQILSALQKLNRTHYPVWVHANNHGRVEESGGVVVPQLIEITYVNRKCHVPAETIFNGPLNIDSPNVREYLDIELKNW